MHMSTQPELPRPIQKTSRVGAAIERAMRLVEAYKKIDEIFREFPEIVAALGIDQAEPTQDESHPNPTRKEVLVVPRAANNFERIRGFFVANNNQWEQAPRIGEALGLSRGTVATVLWTT